ncbi:MAG: MopE-related protein [bacterium]
MEVCPGVDEDCDGRVDEAPDEGAACTVGVGACARPGRLVCVEGAPGCEGEAAPPTPEICNEIDDDCDGVVDPPPTCEVFASCQVARDAGHRASGVFRLQPGPDLSVFEVWCDQTDDGGGWARVAASRASPLRPAVGPWHADLARPSPEGDEARVWPGLAHLDVRFDLRLGCAGPGAACRWCCTPARRTRPSPGECPAPAPLAARDLATGRWRAREPAGARLACSVPDRLRLRWGGGGDGDNGGR